MTTLLTLEASSDSCSVTLTSTSFCESLTGKEERSHSQLLLPFIDQLLVSNNLRLNDLDVIACSQGPGSFTGLRICFSIAQGLAYGADLPMITVCSLESMAMECQNHYVNNWKYSPKACAQHVTIAVIDARMDQVYWAAILNDPTYSGVDCKVLLAPQLQFVMDANTQIYRFLAANPNYEYSFVGSGVPLLQSEGLVVEDALFDGNIKPTSLMSSKLAIKKWDQGLAVSPENAALVYLRDTVSWQKRIKIRSA